MLLRRLYLQNFRNIALARLELPGPRQFFLGPNGQGKTNVLEAAGLLGALRSFRGAKPGDLVRHGESEARIWCEIEHERDGLLEVEIVLKPARREVSIQGAPCVRLADFLGRFPVVALSSNDLQLLRGAPQLRRRAMDLQLSSQDEKYFNALQRYHEGLEGRTALLRHSRDPSTAELSAFEAAMAKEAVTVCALRTAATKALSVHMRAAYGKLAGEVAEAPDFTYASETAAATPEDWRAVWQGARAGDLAMRATRHGPHRDNFSFELDAVGAKSFASEGQQRGLVVAWRLAQAAWTRERTGIAPLLLADDILGELDPARRTGFWRAAADAAQVLATGTTAPPTDDSQWNIWQVRAGNFTPQTVTNHS
jgi:DNA replication and repair protein RecF